MTRAAPSKLEAILPILVRIQTTLDRPLGLEGLARAAGLSQFHFHRLFREVVGETPKQYALRLRLERAAVQLVLDDASILDVALDAGFEDHSTFSRAFRRRFGTTAREFRRGARAPEPRRRRSPLALAELHRGHELSETRVRDLGPIRVAFIRHVGPYEHVDVASWDRLLGWARRVGLPGPHVLLGIAHDAPGITQPEALRFDAALRIDPNAVSAPSREIGMQTLPARPYAVTTHVGPFASLEAGYKTVFARLAKLKRYRVIGLPAVEIYHSTRIATGYALEQTDIAIPLAAR